MADDAEKALGPHLSRTFAAPSRNQSSSPPPYAPRTHTHTRSNSASSTSSTSSTTPLTTHSCPPPYSAAPTSQAYQPPLPTPSLAKSFSSQFALRVLSVTLSITTLSLIASVYTTFTTTFVWPANLDLAPTTLLLATSCTSAVVSIASLIARRGYAAAAALGLVLALLGAVVTTAKARDPRMLEAFVCAEGDLRRVCTIVIAARVTAWSAVSIEWVAVGWAAAVWWTADD